MYIFQFSPSDPDNPDLSDWKKFSFCKGLIFDEMYQVICSNDSRVVFNFHPCCASFISLQRQSCPVCSHHLQPFHLRDGIDKSEEKSCTFKRIKTGLGAKGCSECFFCHSKPILADLLKHIASEHLGKFKSNKDFDSKKFPLFLSLEEVVSLLQQQMKNHPFPSERFSIVTDQGRAVPGPWAAFLRCLTVYRLVKIRTNNNIATLTEKMGHKSGIGPFIPFNSVGMMTLSKHLILPVFLPVLSRGPTKEEIIANLSDAFTVQMSDPSTINPMSSLSASVYLQALSLDSRAGMNDSIVSCCGGDVKLSRAGISPLKEGDKVSNLWSYPLIQKHASKRGRVRSLVLGSENCLDIGTVVGISRAGLEVLVQFQDGEVDAFNPAHLCVVSTKTVL
ncbi:hypothetical protein ADUPG1_006489 [Aduncisulcus paluster]|uniref:Uncharacterized protein n=1 Tax=Aduncisulcus paluster TaxID=2918883 RepID=A0ABQ5KIF5_9EUKA|nr:hypothetical protein ADUPG1_006489 [Aduncisulcus paluster]